MAREANCIAQREPLSSEEIAAYIRRSMVYLGLRSKRNPEEVKDIINRHLEQRLDWVDKFIRMYWTCFLYSEDSSWTAVEGTSEKVYRVLHKWLLQPIIDELCKLPYIARIDANDGLSFKDKFAERVRLAIPAFRAEMNSDACAVRQKRSGIREQYKKHRSKNNETEQYIEKYEQWAETELYRSIDDLVRKQEDAVEQYQVKSAVRIEREYPRLKVELQKLIDRLSDVEGEYLTKDGTPGLARQQYIERGLKMAVERGLPGTDGIEVPPEPDRKGYLYQREPEGPVHIAWTENPSDRLTVWCSQNGQNRTSLLSPAPTKSEYDRRYGATGLEAQVGTARYELCRGTREKLYEAEFTTRKTVELRIDSQSSMLVVKMPKGQDDEKVRIRHSIICTVRPAAATKDVASSLMINGHRVRGVIKGRKPDEREIVWDVYTLEREGLAIECVPGKWYRFTRLTFGG